MLGTNRSGERGSLLCEPGSELRLGRREKEGRRLYINGTGEKKETKKKEAA